MIGRLLSAMGAMFPAPGDEANNIVADLSEASTTVAPLTGRKDRMTDELEVGDWLLPSGRSLHRDIDDACRSLQPVDETDPYAWPHLCTRPALHSHGHAVHSFTGRVLVVWPRSVS